MSIECPKCGSPRNESSTSCWNCDSGSLGRTDSKSESDSSIFEPRKRVLYELPTSVHVVRALAWANLVSGFLLCFYMWGDSISIAIAFALGGAGWAVISFLAGHTVEYLCRITAQLENR